MLFSLFQQNNLVELNALMIYAVVSFWYYIML